MEQRLKQRLVGAIVLVSLAVIFVPIILEGPDDEWAPRNHSMPEPPRMDYGVDMGLTLPPEEPAEPEEIPATPPQETVTATETAPAPAARPPEAEAAPTPAPEAAAPEPVAVQEPAAAKPPPPPPAEPPAREQATLAVPPTGWYIQVGSFSQRMNAEGLRDRLQAAGHATQIQAINIGKAQVYRVLVGPAKSRAIAERQNSELAQKQKLKGIVIEYPG